MPSSSNSALARVFPALLGIAGILYPFLYYAAHQRVPVELFGILACALLVLRLGMGGEWGRLLRAPVLVALVPVAVLLLLDAPLAAKAYPVIMSWALASAFAISLAGPLSLVERLAALRGTPVTAAMRRYCRRVTMAWAAWLLINGLIAAYLAWAGSVAAWTLWTGLISYLVTAALFAGEFALRRSQQQRQRAE